MKGNLRILVWLIFTLMATLEVGNAYAQERKVTGKVISSTDKLGLPGVNVQVSGTTQGTVTDADGNYSIQVPGNSAVLVYSYIGFVKQEITVGSKSVIDVTLSDDIKSLSEVVVTGYGSQSKRDITGAVTSLDAKQLLTTPSTNIGQALQGKVAGVTIGNENSPGGGVMVRIRGFGTINDNSPLYVIDGMPTKGNLNTLNLNDVENMQILKDASAASIYGARAGNGVVIITTKRGKMGKPQFTYDMYMGTQQPGKITKFANTKEWADIYWKAKRNSGGSDMKGDNPVSAQYGNGATPVIPDYVFPAGTMEGDPKVAQANGQYTNYSRDVDAASFNSTNWLITKANKQGTQWMDELFHSAPIQNHQLGVSGGNEGGRYAMTLNMFDQKGIMIYTKYKRYSLRANTEFNVNKRVRVGQNLQIAYGQRVDQLNGNGSESNPISFAYRMQPIIPIYDVSGVTFAGGRGSELGNSRNPIADMWRNKDNVQREMRIFGNAFAEVDILKTLTFKTSFGIDYNNFNYRNFTMRDIESPEARATNTLVTTNNNELTYVWYNTLNYSLNLGTKHKFNVILGTEAIKNHFEAFDATRTKLQNESLFNRYLNAGTAGQLNSGTGSDWKLASEFGKLNYSFLDRFLLDATFRRDRSSRFGSAYNSAFFPAVSGGWIISEENFTKGLPWISFLKLRAGWGQTGNQEIGNYNPYTLYSVNPATSFYDAAGTRSSALPGYELTQFGNTKAKWETTTSSNIGFDARFLGSKLDISLDLYNRTTTDMLFPVQPPFSMGVAVAPFQNIGKMRNKGIDFGASYEQKIGTDLTVTLGGNISMYRNEVLKTTGNKDSKYFGINDERISDFVVTQQGHPISSFYGYVVEGIFQTNAEAEAAAPQFGSPATENKAGRFHFKDVNNDGKIDLNDRTFIGSPHPDFSYGINLNVTYKFLSLNVFGSGVQGNDIFNYTKYFTDFPTFLGAKSLRVRDQAWEPGKTDAILPQVKTADQVSIQPSSYYIESGSYFRMKNIQLTFTVPPSLTSKLKIGPTRVYVQTQNLFTISKYSGMDPEVNSRNFSTGSDRQIGVDGGTYPVSKQFIVGVNLSF